MKSKVNKSDRELAKEVQDGNENSFSLIYAKYISIVTIYFINATGNHKENSKDLSIEVMAKMFEKIDSFDPERAKFSTWVKNICKNHFIDHLRSKKVEILNIESLSIMGDEDEGGEMSFQIKSDFLNPEEVIAQKEGYETIINLFNKIKSKRTKEVLRLRYVEDMSYLDIAEDMEISISNVKQIIFRGRDDVRKLIGKYNVDTSLISAQ